MSEMYAEERRSAMAQSARAHGRVSVAELAERFEVTTETVRRDLKALEGSGLLRRVHGGAVLAGNLSMTEPTLGARTSERAGAKSAIGAAAVRLLPRTGPCTVLIDAGSTTVQAAARLPERGDLTVITNAHAVAAAAGERAGEVHVLGGRLRPVTGALVGAATITRLHQLRADLLFLGANGVTPAHGCSTPDAEEAAVKAAMVAAAARVVLLADSAKLGVERLVSFAGLDAIDVIVTDTGLADADAAMLADHGIEVIRA